MTAKSAGSDPKQWVSQLPSTTYQGVLKSAEVLYRNAVVAMNTSGQFVEAVGTDASLICYGFHDLADADSVTGDGTIEIKVSSGCKLLVSSGLTQADEGKTVFVVDDQTFSTSSNSGARPVMGVLRKYVSATAGYVEIHPVLSEVLTAKASNVSAQAQINVPIQTAILAAGTPMAAFADNAASNPGVTLADSKSVALRWNNAASQTAVWLEAPMPQDLDDASNIVIHALASKSGATVGDATTFTIAAYFQTVGALHDADADCGGATSALTGNATAKTVAEVTRTIAAADVPTAPASLSFSIKPTDGTLGTDDAMIHAIWIEYTRKPLTG